MRIAVSVISCCGLFAALALAQTQTQAAFEASPMEAFALQSGARAAWSSEIGHMEQDGSRAVFTALVVEDAGQPAHRVRGIRIDLSSGQIDDTIYLDEESG